LAPEVLEIVSRDIHDTSFVNQIVTMFNDFYLFKKMFYSIEKSMKIILMQTLQKNNGFGTSCRIISFFSTNA